MMKSQEALNVACPAGVEPATYGLEVWVKKNHLFKLTTFHN